jgi:Cytochrome c554 and c-prime
VLSAIAVVVALSNLPTAVTAAATGSYKHLGVATCAASVCHGKIAPQSGRDVALNEYRTWTQNDRHSLAFKTLATVRSKAIAAKLGLSSASGAKVCLDCHADNVPKELQGPKFQLSDGVGCEACHGGAERWIETHTQQTVTRAANVLNGMYASEQPIRRAELCLSCHLGTRDKFATHAIMGAGHPRLSFEMEAFTVLQPAHFVVDADYVRRKGNIAGTNLWVTGQLAIARRYLALIQSALLTPGGLTPELAFYDCFSCHHTLEQLRWSSARAGAGVRPGAIRLQAHHFVSIRAIAEALQPADVLTLQQAVNALVRAGQSDAASIRAAAATLDKWLAEHSAWASRGYSKTEAENLRRNLVRYAAEDQASDFGAAEQMVMGLDSLSLSIGDYGRHKTALDALYEAVKTSAAFSPAKFSAAAAGVRKQF